MAQGKLLVAQGGGPTAVINESLVGAVLEARKSGAFEAVYGARHGVRGIVDEDFLDLSGESDESLARVGATPCSALGSTRDKPDLAYCQEIFRVLKAHGIATFFYIGGNDSSDTLRILADEAAKESYALRCIHIPKTIDNDLMENDHTPGYPSAAKFVASAFAGVNLDNRALPGVYIGVVMGRNAGFLTAAAAALRKYADDGPHLVYVPERVFEMERFVADVKAVHGRFGRCVVAVSEGVHDEAGEPIVTKLSRQVERDAHGNIQLSGTGALADLLAQAVKESTDIKRVRADTFGYLQRSFLGVVSDVDRSEARRVGEKAVWYAQEAGKDGSVTIRRLRDDYAVDYRLVALEAVAGKTRVMPEDFVTEAGNDVSEKFLDYVRPLLSAGVPEAFRLEAPAVEKILAGRSSA